MQRAHATLQSSLASFRPRTYVVGAPASFSQRGLGLCQGKEAYAYFKKGIYLISVIKMAIIFIIAFLYPTFPK